MKVKLTYESCAIATIGMEMYCPLCGVLCRSLQAHSCSRPKKVRKAKQPQLSRSDGAK